MYILISKSLSLIVSVCLLIVAGCVEVGGLTHMQVQSFCTFQNNIDDTLGHTVRVPVVILLSRHNTAVSSAECPDFGMALEEAHIASLTDGRSLNSLRKAMHRAYENYLAGKDRQAISVILVGTLVRAGSENAVLFRAQRADNIRLIVPPTEFAKAAEEALRPSD